MHPRSNRDLEMDPASTIVPDNKSVLFTDVKSSFSKGKPN